MKNFNYKIILKVFNNKTKEEEYYHSIIRTNRKYNQATIKGKAIKEAKENNMKYINTEMIFSY